MDKCSCCVDFLLQAQSGGTIHELCPESAFPPKIEPCGDFVEVLDLTDFASEKGGGVCSRICIQHAFSDDRDHIW